MERVKRRERGVFDRSVKYLEAVRDPPPFSP
jgi:hypothetical protein